MSLRAVIELLPYRLRSRFNSLGSYVQGCIDETINDMRRGQARNVNRVLTLSSEDRQTIQLIGFVVFIGRFFKDGTRAASLATDAFASLGTPGFQIGRTEFEGRNVNVMRGQSLHNALIQAVNNPEISQWVDSPLPLGEIVRRLVERAING